MKQKLVPSSIIQFSVANFGCFRDRVDFSMAGRHGSKNTFPLLQTDDQLFTTAIIYGPNASGKSTLIRALTFMINKIQKSTSPEHIKTMRFTPFLMEEGCEQKPSFFEIVFLMKKKVYRYNFSLFSNHLIEEEKLYEVKKTSDALLFHRKKNDFDVKNKFSKDEAIQKKTVAEALFLSVSSQWNVSIAQEILAFFAGAINAIQGFETHQYGAFSVKRSQQNKEHREKALEYLRKADFCISNFRIIEKAIPEEMLKLISAVNANEVANPTQKVTTVNFSHPKYDSFGNVVGEIEIPIGEESKGTQTFFEELGPIIDTLESGKVLFIDELNSSLHPFLCQFIVELFNSKITNPNNAQLIFTTHDVTLLSDKSIDRDQFWFTARDRCGAAKLFSLAEFKDRKDSSDFQARYLSGRYGALPFIDDSFLKN